MLERIRYFQQVVGHGSFSRAAEDCHISQSAISQQVAALERELGFLLLQRRHRSFTLTPAGEYFYRNTLTLTEDLDRIIREACRIADPDVFSLEIGVVHGAEGLVQEAICQFLRAHPEVELHLVFGSHESLFQQLRQDALDLAINDQHRAFSSTYRNDILCTLPWRIAGTAGGTADGRIDVRQLRSCPCILPDPDESDREYAASVLGLAGPVVAAASLSQAHLLAAAGQGVLPCTDDAALPSLIRDGQELNRTFCAFTKIWNHKEALEDLIRLIHKNIKSMGQET